MVPKLILEGGGHNQSTSVTTADRFSPEIVMSPTTVSHAHSEPHPQPLWVPILENMRLRAKYWRVCG